MSLHGVAPDRVCSDGRFHTPSGELLPRLSILTSSAQAPYPSPRRIGQRQGSFISLCLLSPQSQRAALRGPRCGAEAVYFCCTFPGVAPGGCYPLSLPCGARTFLTSGPFAPDARLSSLLAKSILTEKREIVKSDSLGYNALEWIFVLSNPHPSFGRGRFAP